MPTLVALLSLGWAHALTPTHPQLEYDSEDSGGFEPLRFLPRNKRLILGLVSTKTPKVCAAPPLLLLVAPAPVARTSPACMWLKYPSRPDAHIYTTQLEDPEVLRRRIMQAADVIAHGEVPRTKEEALDQYVPPETQHKRVK